MSQKQPQVPRRITIPSSRSGPRNRWMIKSLCRPQCWPTCKHRCVAQAIAASPDRRQPQRRQNDEESLPSAAGYRHGYAEIPRADQDRLAGAAEFGRHPNALK